jgi:hypothetical protein
MTLLLSPADIKRIVGELSSWQLKLLAMPQGHKVLILKPRCHDRWLAYLEGEGK